MTKLQNLNRDNSKNSNCDKNQKLKLWPNSKTQIVTTKKNKLWQLKNSNSDKNQMWKQLDTLTTDEMFLVELFAILAMFSFSYIIF